MFKFLKIFFGIVIVGLVTVVGLIYFFRDKITESVLARAKSDLADEGVFVDWRLEPITFGPDLVLKFRDLKTYRDSSCKEVGAELSKLDVHVHLMPTLTQKKPHATLLVEDASLTFLDLAPKAAEEEQPAAPKAETASTTAPATESATAPATEAATASSAAPAAPPEPTPVAATPSAAPQAEPAKPKLPEMIAVTELNLNAELNATQWRISPSSMLFQGIRFSVSGISDLPRSGGGKHKPLIKTVEVRDPSAPAEPSSLDFSALVPVAEALDYRNAGFKPEIKASYTATLDRDGAWTIDAKADTVSFPSRDKNLAIATQSIIRHDASGEIRSLVIKDGASEAKGTATIEKGAAALNVSSLSSSLDWIGILRDLPVVDHTLDAYRITSNPNIELAGLWSFSEPKTSAMNGTIQGLHGTYTQLPAGGGKPGATVAPLVLKDAEAEVQIGGGTMHFKNGFGSLADGPVRFEFRIQPFETNAMPWALRLAGENLALAQLTSAFADAKVEGTASVSFEGGGDLKPAALNGQGALQVVATQPLKIPLVGPLLDLLATVIPNLFKSESDRLETTFTIKDGVLTTEDLSVGLSAVQVNATGTINLPTEETKFEANANLRGALQRLTPGLPGVLAIEGGGPLKKVNWKFKNFQLANGLSNLLRGGGSGQTPSPAPATVPGAEGQMAPAPGGDQPATPSLPAKAEELIRTVDQIGGLLKGLKGEAKPPVPVPAPTTPPAPAPAPAPAPPANP